MSWWDLGHSILVASVNEKEVLAEFVCKRKYNQSILVARVDERAVIGRRG